MSVPRYERYKDSGVEWLGEVPYHWSAGRFSRVISRIKDGTHGTFARMDFGQPLLSAKNVQNGEIEITEEESVISDEDHRSIVSNGFPKRGDLLLTIVGTIGRACLYRFDEPLAFQRSVCFIRLCDWVSEEFFYYATQSQFFQEQLQSRSKSSAQAGVYMGDVVATEVAYPTDRSEQLAISSFLDRETAKIDALIEEQRRLIELLKEKRQAVILHAITKGLNPAASIKDSGIELLGEIPRHWEIMPLRFLAKFVSGGTPDKKVPSYWEGSIPWISAKDMKVLRIADAEDHVSESAVVESGLKLISEGHLLMVVRGMILAHSLPVALTCGNVTINQDLKAIKCGDKMSVRLLQFVFEAFKSHIIANAGESAHGTKKLESDMLGRLEIPVPPIEEQHLIVAELEREVELLDAVGNSATQTMKLLQERRSALISAAVTGKIDVRGERNGIQ
jgi:type I restriction enzyme, S subunit